LRILLLCSAINGLSQRVWTTLQADGHTVTPCAVSSPAAIAQAAAAEAPDLIICPFLKQRVPTEVWSAYRTIIIHPGPKGDRGPSSLDWAIMDAEPWWGVTAIQAIEELDAGPIWGSRTFAVPVEPPRKSSLYNAEVADAAVSLTREVVAKAVDPTFHPEPLDPFEPDVIGRSRPSATQADRAFDWGDPTERVLRMIRAADGSPGVRTTLAGLDVAVFDAHAGSAPPGEPGTISLRRHGAVLVHTGDGAVWVGHARSLVPQDARPSVKLPATLALGAAVATVPEALEPLESPETDGYREIRYRRVGDVGVLHFDFYNGAMSTSHCHRLASALHWATNQDTSVLLLQGGETFSNGIHLNVIEAHPNPMMAAWRNINAINDVCRALITCTRQLVVAAMPGGAGAGGVMMALGADRVVLSSGSVLNPHYRTMGLFGSEYWTYTLPRRVGREQATRLTTRCEPVGADHAVRIGLADAVLPGDRTTFTGSVLDYAGALAADPALTTLLAQKRTVRAADEERRPLETYRVRELAEMSHDIFDDRNGFAELRRAFVNKSGKPAASRTAAADNGRANAGTGTEGPLPRPRHSTETIQEVATTPRWHAWLGGRRR
jgi:putative two-component system hydrogenase maturation factor HypX/HoxX